MESMCLSDMRYIHLENHFPLVIHGLMNILLLYIAGPAGNPKWKIEMVNKHNEQGHPLHGTERVNVSPISK